MNRGILFALLFVVSAAFLGCGSGYPAESGSDHEGGGLRHEVAG